MIETFWVIMSTVEKDHVSIKTRLVWNAKIVWLYFIFLMDQWNKKINKTFENIKKCRLLTLPTIKNSKNC